MPSTRVSTASTGSLGVAAVLTGVAESAARSRSHREVNASSEILMQSATSQRLKLLEGIHDERVFSPGLGGHVEELFDISVADSKCVKLDAKFFELFRCRPRVSSVGISIGD